MTSPNNSHKNLMFQQDSKRFANPCAIQIDTDTMATIIGLAHLSSFAIAT